MKVRTQKPTHLYGMIQIVGRPKTADDNAVTYNDAGLPTEIEIMKCGSWNFAFEEPVVIDIEDLNEMVDNFNAGLRKGVALDCDHDQAASTGWIQSLRVSPDLNGVATLYATVEWTPLGAQLLTDKIYKFFSPEWYSTYADPESGKVYENVLTGGALTNRPLMKALAPLTASEGVLTLENQASTLFIESNITNQRKATNNNMNLAELRSKSKTELTADEKAFLVKHASELTAEEAEALEIEKPVEEDKKEVETPAATPEANTANEGVKISASELAALQASANAGVEAMKKLQAAEAKEKMQGFIASEVNKDGKFTPAMLPNLASFYNSLTSTQASEFEALVNQMPALNLFSEIGSSEESTASNAADVLDKKAHDFMASEKAAGRDVNYSDALKKIASENPALITEHESTLPNK